MKRLPPWISPAGRWRAGMFACLSIGLASGAASAMSLTWSVTGGRFADGGTLSGTFEQNPENTRPTTWDVNVAGGSLAFPALSYTPGDSHVFMLDWPPNVELTYHFVVSAANRQLRLTPASPLDGSVATVPLSFLSSQGAVECFNCAPFRDITAGSLVLTAATPTLILESTAPDPTVAGAPTTATISIDSIAVFGPPTGTVTVLDSSDLALCTITLPATSCTFAAPTTHGGHMLHARYGGNASYTSVASNDLDFTVDPAQTTTVTLSVSPNPTMIDTATTATVLVAAIPALGPPTGMIRVYLNVSSATLCTITLPATTCTFATTGSGPDIQVGAAYGGNVSYASEFSNLVLMTVAPVPPVVTLVSMVPNPTAVDTATTATVTVGTVSPFAPPTGTITVFDTDGDSLCTIALPATSCMFTPSASGGRRVVARYEGDAHYDSGLSNPRLLTVLAPPTIAKAFVPPGIPVNGTTALTFTLNNPNTGAALTGVGFTDTLPAGLAVVNGTGATCGGTLTKTGGNTIALAGAVIAPSGTCSFSATVTATSGGLKNNVTSVVTSAEGGTGGTASASLVVVTPPAVSPPTIAKSFGAASIAVNATTTLTFTLTNPNAGTALTGAGFTDMLPAGLVVASGARATCGGTLTTSGGNTIALMGARIPAGATCTFPVMVTGTTAGAKMNTTGPVTSIEGGTGGTASAILTVAATVVPPTIAKSFSPANVGLNGTTTLTFTLANPNSGGVLTGVGFTDTLPSGLAVATPNGATNNCGGSVAAAAGGGGVAFADGALPASGSCAITLNVTATTDGAKNNTTSAITSTEGGTGGTASATLTVTPAVVGPPAIAIAFDRPVIALSETTSLTFALTNPNPGAALTGVGFTDALPAGLVVATPNGLANTCGGVTSAVAGGGQVALAGGGLPAGGSCTITVEVTGVSVGLKRTASSRVTSIEGGSGEAASARLLVLPSPAPIPTLSPRALAILALLVAAAGVFLLFRLR